MIDHETHDELALLRERRELIRAAVARDPDREREIRAWVAWLEACVTEAARYNGGMEAGRYLDTLVAEKVMGWTPIPDAPTWSDQWRDRDGYPRKDRPYSTDIAAAWEVVERLKDAFPELEVVHARGQVEAVLIGGPKPNDPNGEHWIFRAWAATAPMAICLAALKAVGVQVD